MNALFIFAGALDLETNHARLAEFWRLDREIAKLDEEMSYEARFHSLEYAALRARAKFIVKQLSEN